MQGLLELTGLPYGGPHLLAATCGMDKIVMKAAFAAAGIPLLPQVVCSAREWREQQEEIIAKVERQLGYPVMVKPANLGSSIGINKGSDRQGLIDICV